MSRIKERTGSKMANFKKKQDDKNLKTLRELASLCCNKQCFDCYQKGPTYINMTIGSFVCTSCSGLLRGLNPPHRVKSISMATFTADEIEFVKARGNEYCRSVWMGRYDKGRGLDEGSFKDETQMKDYLNLKYEKKRWYISPSEVVKTADSHACRSNNDVSHAADQITKEPIASMTIANQVRSRPANNRPLETTQVASKETLFSFDVDPFSPSDTNDQPKLSNPSNMGFANFANFESHTVQPTSLSPLKPTNDNAIGSLFANPTVNANVNNNSADKYSALAELDELFRNDNAAATGTAGGQQSITAPLKENFLFDFNPVDGPFASRSPASIGLHGFDSAVAAGRSPPVNPFFPTAKPPDSNLFASLNPFGDQQSTHGVFNGVPKAPSSVTPNNNLPQNANMQSNWNPFI